MSKFDIDAYGCPICLEILVEPITMPCSHRMCKPCFAKNLELTNLHCPFCKKRIGTWCRQAKKLESLIDQPLWKEIQDKFQKEVEDRNAGSAETLFDEGGFCHDFTYEDGVIGREFEEQMEQLRREEELRKSKELVESEKLIKAIQLEELEPSGSIEQTDSIPEATDSSFIAMQRQLETEIEQQKRDEELARRLQKQLEKSPQSSMATRRASLTPARAKKSKPVTKGARQLTLQETLNQGKKRKWDQSS